MIGSLLGFLRFNSYRRGSSWATAEASCWDSRGVVAVVLTQDPSGPTARRCAPAAGLPILDTVTVMIRRVALGQSPFVADRRHLHHRLLPRFDHFEAVVLIYVVQAVLFMIAWQMRYESDLAVLAAFLVVAGHRVAALPRHRYQWQWQGLGGPAGWAGRGAHAVAQGAHAPPALGNVIAWTCTSVYLLAVSVTSTVISRDSPGWRWGWRD